MRALVLLPAFNEAARIGRVLGGIRAAAPEATVLVVDDGSADDTAGVARAAGARVVRLPFNLGAGVAAQTGYKFAVREGFDCVVHLDSDGQHEPADIPALLAVIARREADVAIGSRFLGGADYRAGALRRTGMGVFRLLAWLLTGVRFSDVTSGFRAFGRDVIHFVATAARGLPAEGGPGAHVPAGRRPLDARRPAADLLRVQDAPVGRAGAAAARGVRAERIVTWRS